MEKVKLEIEVAKESYELGLGLSKLVKAVKVALDDGFQPGQDLPVILTSALADLIPAVQGVDKIKLELQEGPEAFADALYLGLRPIPFLFIKGDEVEPE